MLAGDIKEKDTEVDELQLRLRETERKCMWTHTKVTCIWSHTNAMLLYINAKED